MPNWCFNTAVITAKTKEELEEFIQFAKKTHTSNFYEPFTDVKVKQEQGGVFWNFITPPAEILDPYYAKESPRYSDSLPMNDPDWYKQVEERRAKSNHWYDWNLTNWGVKWDCGWDEQDEPEVVDLKDGEHFLVWHFDTAWGAPVPVYHAMAERFPNIEFDFEATEESNAFLGKMTFVNGKAITDEWVRQPTHEDYTKFDIPCINCGSEYDESCWGHKGEVEA